ncbi:glycosyltransferase 61 family protein (plasmid) [Rhodopseudomonas palustris]
MNLLTERLDLTNESDALVRVIDAIVVPPESSKKARESRSGVLDADGKFVAQSISWTSPERPVNAAPELPNWPIESLDGSYLFGGILYGHFGHFIVESLSRLWAQDAVDVPINGIIFTPKIAGFPRQAVEKLQYTARYLGLRLPIIVAEEATRVKELFVPRQGFGMGKLISGSRAFRTFMNANAGTSVEADGDECLYISRSALPPMRGSILGEEKLEEYLIDEGYHIFHPQQASIEEQIARYKAARVVISVDCSPVHLLAYVCQPKLRAAILSRRSMEISEYLVEQLSVFKGANALAINALVNDWMPQPGNRPSRTSFGEVDFGLLHARLLGAGFINNPTPWVSLTEAERASELARLEASHDTSFLPFR